MAHLAPLRRRVGAAATMSTRRLPKTSSLMGTTQHQFKVDVLKNLGHEHATRRVAAVRTLEGAHLQARPAKQHRYRRPDSLGTPNSAPPRRNANVKYRGVSGPRRAGSILRPARSRCRDASAARGLLSLHGSAESIQRHPSPSRSPNLRLPPQQRLRAFVMSGRRCWDRPAAEA